jgi:hypothetical protein
MGLFDTQHISIECLYADCKVFLNVMLSSKFYKCNAALRHAECCAKIKRQTNNRFQSPSLSENKPIKDK